MGPIDCSGIINAYYCDSDGKLINDGELSVKLNNLKYTLAANSLCKSFKPLIADPEPVCLELDRVIFNDPATIIFWKSWHIEEDKDGNKFKVQDKTVVKCAKNEKFNKYNGFCAAVAKRVFETNSAIQHIIREAQDNSDAKKLVKEIVNTGKKVKAQRENAKNENKKGGSKKNG